MKILHIITDLSPDGAQRTLLRLLARLPRSGVEKGGFEFRVISLMAGGHLLERFEELGIPVEQLGMSRGVPGPRVLKKLRAAVRAWRPDLIQGWMYHGNLAGLVGARLAGLNIPVLWNIRRCLYETSQDKALTRLVIRLGATMSKRADKIVYCVDVASRQHESIGFDAGRRVVIPNGFDIGRFIPTGIHRDKVRDELGVSKDTFLAGIAGRYHPQKDFPSFLRAAARIARKHPDVHFVMIGRNVTLENEEVWSLVQALELQERVHLLGERQDVPAILASLDLFVSSSRNEGFSNVVGEAMACGVPCVATDAGASRELLEGLCPVVVRGDDAALTAGIETMLSLVPEERARIGALCRMRIEERYSLDAMVRRYADLYRSFDPTVLVAA